MCRNYFGFRRDSWPPVGEKKRKKVNEKGTTELKAGTHRTVKFWTVAFIHDR
jgi:hypothetical protein